MGAVLGSEPQQGQHTKAKPKRNHDLQEGLTSHAFRLGQKSNQTAGMGARSARSWEEPFRRFMFGQAQN